MVAKKTKSADVFYGRRKLHEFAVELGRKGGLSTAKKRTKAERSAMARKAVQARWAKEKKVSQE